MAWDDATELVVAGTGEVYVAPVGTALPTTETSALNAAFSGLGYLTTDGFSLSVGVEVQDIESWQSLDPTRTEVQRRPVQVTFVLQQWNDATVPFAFGGGSIATVSTDHYRYDPPASSAALAEKAMVIDAVDGSRINRFVIKRGTVRENVESQFTRGAEAGLPITFGALAPADASLSWNLYSNDTAAYAAGS